MFLVFSGLLSCTKEKKETTETIEYCNKENSIIYSPNVFIYIPNLYTPNGDGLNDVIVINSRPKMKNIEFELYNAKGILLYSNQKDTNLMFFSPYDEKQIIKTDQVLNYKLKCELDTHKINTTGKITLVYNIEASSLKIKNCELCFFSDMFNLNYNDSLVIGYPLENLRCE